MLAGASRVKPLAVHRGGATSQKRRPAESLPVPPVTAAASSSIPSWKTSPEQEFSSLHVRPENSQPCPVHLPAPTFRPPRWPSPDALAALWPTAVGPTHKTTWAKLDRLRVTAAAGSGGRCRASR